MHLDLATTTFRPYGTSSGKDVNFSIGAEIAKQHSTIEPLGPISENTKLDLAQKGPDFLEQKWCLFNS